MFKPQYAVEQRARLLGPVLESLQGANLDFARGRLGRNVADFAWLEHALQAGRCLSECVSMPSGWRPEAVTEQAWRLPFQPRRDPARCS